MKYLVASPDQVQGDRIVLDPDQRHHLETVMRRRDPEGFWVVVWERGERLRTRPAGSSGLLAVTGREPLPPVPVPAVHVALGILRGGCLDEAVAGLVGLGIDGIHLMRAERCQPDRVRAVKLDRLCRITRSACEQSGRWNPVALTVHESVEKFLGAFRGAALHLFGLEPMGATGSELAAPAGPPDLRPQVALVGPEGDFTPGEVARIRSRGGEPVHLRSPVLRSELAVMVAATLLLARSRRI